MHSINGQLIFSATDLSNFLACPHLSQLNRRTAFGGPKPPVYDDPGLEVLRLRGLEHEQRYLTNRKLVAETNVVEVSRDNSLPTLERWQKATQDTMAAMEAGADIIYQGTLFDGQWLGFPDFLEKVDTPSSFGNWSYEVVDTKLAREAKGGALLQVLLYAHLLEKAQGVAPSNVHIALGGPDAHTETFRVADYAAYFRSVKHRFEQAIANAPAEICLAPDPVAHCDICAWGAICDRERRDVDHLSLVAGITTRHRNALVERGIATLEQLGETALPLTPKLDGVHDVALQRIHAQALIQLQGRRANAPKYELLTPVTAEQGLAALPAPSPGDLFFDLEGDPYAFTHGIEYLFGYTDADGAYYAAWALAPEEERKAFEDFIDMVMARWQQHPDMHIYHFAPYEPSALKRLMGRYGTREDEIDRLLRGKVFVDLYRVVRQGMRASVESYSIKKLEPFYGYERDVDLRAAGADKAYFEAWLELGGDNEGIDALRASVEGYNKDDCVSTLRLRNWLEARRAELEQSGVEVPRPVPANPAPGEEQEKRQAEVDVVVAQLTGDNDDPARALLAHVLEFHRREKKPVWWNYYRRLELSAEDLIEERTTIGGLEYVGVVGEIKKSYVHRYRYPPQEHNLRDGKVAINTATEEKAGEIVAVDVAACTIDLKRGRSSKVAHPVGIMADEKVPDAVMRESLMRLARDVVAGSSSEAFKAALDLLHRKPLPSRVLPIQGPPGSGKTYKAARMIVDALEAGKRVGVTANSHKVISKLLEEVCKAGRERGVAIRGIQKCDEEDKCPCPEIECGENADVLSAITTGGVRLAAGTAWLWSREDMMQSIEVLFIDEAGQFSLANALAVAPSAKEIVLLGDPQQLNQPLQGVHPPGAAVSALGHMLGEHATMPEEQGIFLDRTWRLHPSLCEFTSEVFYEGRLTSHEKERVCAVEPGLRLIAVPHIGNTNESEEEVEAIAHIVAQFVAEGVALQDILIVAPYNMQVSSIARRIPGARVGTVDKFQGQEAPIAIYSTATSTAVEAPRGMTFLYSPNRFNVATSRAQCLAIVVASPDLFVPDCRTPEQMKLANAFCRFAELAGA